MQPKNVFVLGLDAQNLEVLRTVPDADRYRFHPLLSVDELQDGQVDVDKLLATAEAQLEAFDGSVDAIVGFWDFPVSTLVPILCAKYGLRSSDLTSVLKCEHKYWSRLEQAKAVSEIPRFAVLDLDGDRRVPEGMRFPMWVKPVKSFSSDLAFGVKDETEFAAALEEMAQGVSRVGKPFESIMDRVTLPPEIADAGGEACLVEEAITGEQVAVEGYVQNGEVTVYGVLDSVDYEGRSSFLRHQYPSVLGKDVTDRLEEVSRRVMKQMGTNDATFSIEFFHEPATGEITVLEINPRHSQSHAEMFDYVDGVPNHHRMLKLALGEDPSVVAGGGAYQVAAKWYHRRFEDGVMRRVPTAEEVARIEREIPGVKIDVQVKDGDRLAEMPGQDSYSYELTHIFVGAADHQDLRAKYDRVVEALRYEVDAVDAAVDAA